MYRRPRLGLIAYEYPPLIGGMATYARAVAQYMHERGWEVHVFANTQADTVTDPWAVHSVLTTDLARDLPVLNRYRMDMWHAINFGYAPLACLKRPFVLTVHGTDFLKPWVRFKMDRLPLLWRTAPWFENRTFRRRLHQPILRCVDQVLTCSQFSAERFREEYHYHGPLEVVHNGVDQFYLNKLRPNAAVRHPRRILTVCNLDIANRRKNVDGVLRAMAQVGRQLDLQYWIIGDGPERPALERLTRELGLHNRVSFLGRVQPTELHRAYASSSLFVLVPRPQTNDIEGFGIVYLEAAASGTPSLGGRYGGACEAIRDGISGFFADSAEPADIAKALRQYFSTNMSFDPQTVRRHALDHAWPTVLQQVEKSYQRLRPKPEYVNNIAQQPKSSIVERPATPNDQPTDWRQWINRQPTPQRQEGAGRVLLISYPFPPVGGSPVQRPAKLAKYLHKLGWQVDVLTAAHDRFPWRDDSLLLDLPEGVRIHRVPGYEPACIAERIGSFFHRFTGTDARAANPAEIDRHGRWSIRRIVDAIYWRLARITQCIGLNNGEPLWNKPALREACRLHHRQPFDAMISTGPPHFVHEIALQIKRHTQLPWLADLRDPLVSDFDRQGPTAKHIHKMRRLERAIMRHAQKVITTCDALANDLLTRYPHHEPDSVQAITNGYDRDDLLGLVSRPYIKNKDTIFVAAGAFYGRREIARLIRPLERVLARHPEWVGRVKLIIAGSIDAEQRRQWTDRLPEWVQLAGYLDHDTAVRTLAEAACTIMIVPDCAHGRTSIPGKTFELLAVPSHLLALVPPGSDAEKIAAEAGNASIAPFEDEAFITDTIDNIINKHMAGRLDEQRNWSTVGRYDRAVIAGQFAAALNDMLGREPIDPTAWNIEIPEPHSATAKNILEVA